MHVCLPRLCPACGRALLSDEEAMCTHCMLTLPRLAVGSPAGTGVTDALSNGPAEPGFSSVWFRYDRTTPFADLVRSAKYGDRPRQGRLMGRAFARELVAARPDAIEAIEAIDVLLPVPMHWTKQLRRGYNQSAEIAAGIADITGIPVGDNLIATARHHTQARSSRAGRLVNVRNTFTCNCPDELNGLDICIVDDIITTGATIRECVLALGRNGARPASIGVLALGAPV